MNERIKQLAKEAGFGFESFMTYTPRPFQVVGSVENLEKFVELIIKECIQLNNQAMPLTSSVQAIPLYKEHFGVN